MRLYLPVCLLPSVLLTGCVTILDIQSNVRVADKPPFERILIVSRLPNVPPGYASTFVGAFPSQYTVCSVDVSPIDFETPDELVSRQLNECKSQVMLTLDLNRSFSGNSGKYIAGYNNIYLEMSSVATGKPFWKAITLSTTTALSPREIVQRLISDGVLSGKVAVADSRYR
ncbi:hypothetical protein [Spirosoma rhododendri]|uniref:Lipoprotein n=1 Tax=Spirosoma rhododendri TaxID=2728024 RepID=A0A7L5DH79_9BACT|nr:hypothetical protein [Spirosoma rhododendri]QJD77365.1 hypothetical protein HH216_02220 [Spirosoma rhododendri]